LRDRDTDPSLTLRLDLAVRVDLRLDRDPGLRPVDLGARAALPVVMVGLPRVVPGVPGGRVVLRPVGRVVLLDLVLMRRAGLVVPVGRLVLHLAVPVRQRPVHLVVPARRVGMDRADLVHLVVPVDLGRADLADRVVPGLMDLVVLDPVGLADPVGLGLMGRVSRVPVDPVPVVPGLMDPVDRRRRRIGPEVSTIAVVPSLAARTTRRTASAHPTTVRRLRRRNTDSVGTAGLLPERHRPTGTGRRLRVAGTVLRLRVAGTLHGTGRRAT
jgi:hypothetical protein